MVMTVVMADAASALPVEEQALMKRGPIAQLLYADDTLLMSDEPRAFRDFWWQSVAVCGWQLHL